MRIVKLVCSLQTPRGSHSSDEPQESINSRAFDSDSEGDTLDSKSSCSTSSDLEDHSDLERRVHHVIIPIDSRNSNTRGSKRDDDGLDAKVPTKEEKKEEKEEEEDDDEGKEEEEEEDDDEEEEEEDDDDNDADDGHNDSGGSGEDEGDEGERDAVSRSEEVGLATPPASLI